MQSKGRLDFLNCVMRKGKGEPEPPQLGAQSPQCSLPTHLSVGFTLSDLSRQGARTMPTDGCRLPSGTRKEQADSWL